MTYLECLLYIIFVNCLKKLAVLQTCSEVSAILNHYSDAAEYAERVLAAYKKIYPPISTQIGMQSYRLGVHLWHLQAQL